MSSRCEDLRDDVYEFAAGTLDATRQDDMKAHLQTCDECRRALEEARQLVGIVSGWQPEPASPGFEARVRAAILTHELPAREPAWRTAFTGWFSRSFAWKIALPAAAIATLMVTVAVNRSASGLMGIFPQWSSQDPTEKAGGLDVEVEPAPRPIRLEVADVGVAVSGLTDAVVKLHGQVNRRRPVGTGVEVTLQTPADQFPPLLQALRGLGTVTVPESGFTDGAGRIVVLVQR